MNNELTLADRLAYAFSRLTKKRLDLAGMALAVGNGYTVSQRGAILTPYIMDLQNVEAKIDTFVRLHGYVVKPRRNSLSLGRACDSRCTTAKGDVCVCSCDGTNHGIERATLGAFRAATTHVVASAPIVSPAPVAVRVAPPTRTYAPTLAHPFNDDTTWDGGNQAEIDYANWEAENAFDRASAAIAREDYQARLSGIKAASSAIPYEKTAPGARSLAWARR